LLDRFRAAAARAGVLLDMDGTLSEIVRRPELARIVPGAEEAIAALVDRYAAVAVISGRSSQEVRERVRVPGVKIVGSYGLSADPLPGEVEAEATEAVRDLAGAWIDAKGPSLAVHYRETEDPAVARGRLASSLGSVASRNGLRLLEGKMVMELVRPGVALKGGAVQRICEEFRLAAALYAGDDFADLEAFAALDRLLSGASIKVAVSGPETPEALLEAADIVVEGPRSLVPLLRDL
jgi:trehalose 6-phosphate phosphatase